MVGKWQRVIGQITNGTVLHGCAASNDIWTLVHGKVKFRVISRIQDVMWYALREDVYVKR